MTLIKRISNKPYSKIQILAKVMFRAQMLEKEKRDVINVMVNVLIKTIVAGVVVKNLGEVFAHALNNQLI